MHIEIPGDAEPLLRRNAELAGFADVREYVLKLILEDDPTGPADRPDPNDPRIIKAIEDGYASGVAGDAADIIPKLRDKMAHGLASPDDRSN